MKLRTILLIVCTGLAMSITGCLPVSAATRHIVLLFDERVELPGLSLLEAELVRTLRSNSTEPIEVYHETIDFFRIISCSYKTFLPHFPSPTHSKTKLTAASPSSPPPLDY